MNNNQGEKIKVVPTNGGDKTPSFVVANSADKQNAGLANAQQKQASLDGKRAADYQKGSIGSRSSGSGISSSGGGSSSLGANAQSQRETEALEKKNAQRAMDNAKRDVANVKMAVAKEGIKKMAASKGIPEGVAEKALNSKMGNKLLEQALNKGKPLPLRAAEGANKALNKAGERSMGKDESEKTTEEKSDEREAKETQAGEISFNIPMRVLKWIIIIGPMVTILLFFFILVLAALNDEKSSSMIISGMVSDKEGRQLIKDVAFGTGTNTGRGTSGKTVTNS